MCLHPRSRENLEEHLAEIDKQHETLNELRTNGDVYGWNDQFRNCKTVSVLHEHPVLVFYTLRLMKDAEGKMKAATLKCYGRH